MAARFDSMQSRMGILKTENVIGPTKILYHIKKMIWRFINFNWNRESWLKELKTWKQKTPNKVRRFSTWRVNHLHGLQCMETIRLLTRMMVQHREPQPHLHPARNWKVTPTLPIWMESNWFKIRTRKRSKLSFANFRQSLVRFIMSFSYIILTHLKNI